MLFEYAKQTQRLIHDSNSQLIDPQDIFFYVNQARDEVAMRSQCLRVLTPISGSVIGATVTAPGVGYTRPTLTISPPDFPSGLPVLPNGAQATANIVEVGGSIATADITYGGSGYFMPIATITDPTGSGAAVALQTSLLNQTVQGQEVYPFSGVNLANFPGYGSLISLESVSIIYANYRYSLPMYSFSTYQAYIRQYPFQYQYVPTMCSQLGQGAAGSLYTYPLASQAYQMEFVGYCLPQALTDDQSVEAIPMPWQRAVQWWAAKLAFNELQNYNAARAMEEQFDRQLPRYRYAADAGRNVNIYGRY